MCHKTDKNDQKGGKMGTVLADTAGKLSAADLKSWLTDTAKMEAKLAKKPAISMSGYLKGLKTPLSEDEVADLVALPADPVEAEPVARRAAASQPPGAPARGRSTTRAATRRSS